MNTTPADEAMLKTDVLGRVKTPQERREQLLDEFERSGLTRAEVCGGGGRSNTRRLRLGRKSGGGNAARIRR